MTEGDTMMEHINKMRSLAGQLESVGAPITEDDQVATLLCSLPDSYNNLIIALESRADDLTMEFLGNHMITLIIKVSQSPGGAKKKGKCFNCGLQGYYAKECRKPKKKKVEHANTLQSTESDEENHMLFLITQNNEQGSQWYIDSGASQHMANDKNIMDKYCKFSSPEVVRLGDNREVNAYGKGSVWIKIKAEKSYKLAELIGVLYVPSLGKNLFSVSAITRRGYTVSFKKENCDILNDSGTVLGSGKMKGKLFSNNGHLGSNNLNVLQNKNMVEGMHFKPANDENKEPCDACLKGKQSKSDRMELTDDGSDNEERVVNHDNDLEVDEVNNEERDLPRHSTRNRRPPERDNVLTGNWWEIDEALYTCADNVLGEPKDATQGATQGFPSHGNLELHIPLHLHLVSCRRSGDIAG
eukprot:gene17160-18882_t